VRKWIQLSWLNIAGLVTKILHCVHHCVLLVSERWFKGNNASLRSPVMDEERMDPGHWLGSVL